MRIERIVMSGERRTFDWTCPSCGRDQVVAAHEEQYYFTIQKIPITFKGDHVHSYRISCIKCANKTCGEPSLSFSLYKSDVFKQAWQLVPPAKGKPQPDCIPEPLRNDYVEACLIRDLSPKASATLARRCLQGMIRDFCQISKGTLDKEIKALLQLVSENKAPEGVTLETIEAIDHVRRIGNIGAHMEKDINLIIDITLDEARLLIGLIELLFKEWYVAREQRRVGLAALQALAEAKTGKRRASKAPRAVAERNHPEGADA